MHVTIERLIALGYDEQEAEKIYNEHEKENKLGSLYGYIDLKERLSNKL